MMIATRIAALLAALFLAAAPAAHAEPVDRGDPAAVAKAFLTAYQLRRVEALPPLMNSKNRPVFDAMADQGDQHPAYGRVFSGWRAEAADAWRGEIGPLRVSRGEMLAPFHRMNAREIAVVVLQNEGGLWLVEDINSPLLTDFEALPPAP